MVKSALGEVGRNASLSIPMPCGFLYADFCVRIFVCGFFVRIFRADFCVWIFVRILNFLRADFSADFYADFF